jgi:hypothetical protein
LQSASAHKLDVQVLQQVSGIHSYACLGHSKLSWWGLRSSLHLHVAHMHYRSHYSVKSPDQQVSTPFDSCLRLGTAFVASVVGSDT